MRQVPLLALTGEPAQGLGLALVGLSRNYRGRLLSLAVTYMLLTRNENNVQVLDLGGLGGEEGPAGLVSLDCCNRQKVA